MTSGDREPGRGWEPKKMMGAKKKMMGAEKKDGSHQKKLGCRRENYSI